MPVTWRPDDGSNALVTWIAAVGTGAASVITLTLPGVANKTTWLTDFSVNGLGATAASIIEITIVGTLGGTLRFKYSVAVGAAALSQQLYAQAFQGGGWPASAVNTAIVITIPSFGAGNTSANAQALGYQL